MNQAEPQVADALMDDTMRRLWERLNKPWIRRILQDHLPPTQTETLGLKVVVYPHDNFTEFKVWEKGLPPEHEATQFLMDRFAGQDVVIVDVGGNAGLFGLPILNAAGPKARAVLFEPNPVMQARLFGNVALNDLGERATVMPVAVSDADGTLPLFVPKNGNLGQGRIGVAYANAGEGEQLDVPVKVLPACLAEHGVTHIDLLKVDVEGLEDRVILPLLADPDAPKPKHMYFEVAHDGVWDGPLLETLESSGYVEEKRFENNALFSLNSEASE